MFRILEILRLLAPLLGVIMLISYRHRAQNLRRGGLLALWLELSLHLWDSSSALG